MTGAGLKKCIPTTRSGPGARRAIAVTRSDEVFGREHARRAPRRPRRAREELALERQALGRRLDDELAAGAARRSPAARSAARLGVGGPSRARRAARAPRRRALERRAASGSCSSTCARPPARRAGAIPAPMSRRRRRRSDVRSPRRRRSGTQRVDAGLRAPDDQLLDLRRALVQRRDAHVAEVALDGVVVDVARAAVHLDRLVGAPHCAASVA